MHKEELEQVKVKLLAELYALAVAKGCPSRVQKLEEQHKRINAVERCLRALSPA